VPDAFDEIKEKEKSKLDKTQARYPTIVREVGPTVQGIQIYDSVPKSQFFDPKNPENKYA